MPPLTPGRAASSRSGCGRSLSSNAALLSRQCRWRACCPERPQRPVATASLTYPAYTEEILRSGLPGIRDLSSRGRRLGLDGYLDRVVDREFADLGFTVRRPGAVRAWLTAYAAAKATTATYAAIMRAATHGDNDAPPVEQRPPIPRPSPGCGSWTRYQGGCPPATTCPVSHNPPSTTWPTPRWPHGWWGSASTLCCRGEREPRACPATAPCSSLSSPPACASVLRRLVPASTICGHGTATTRWTSSSSARTTHHRAPCVPSQ